MAVRINPPDFNLTKSYERYKQELLAWREVTDLKKEKQGIVLALSLPENEIGIREKVFDNINLADLKKEDGFNTLLTFLDKNLGKDDLADSLDKFEDFEDYERESGQSINEFISKFDQRYNKILRKGMSLPQEILAFKLLKRAKINKEEKMLVMTGMDYTKKEDLYDQAKVSLKKFLGQQAGGGSSSAAFANIKVEPAFVAQEEVTYFSQSGRSRGRYFRPRGFGNGRGRGSTWRGRGQSDRAMNPIGANGRTLTCLACGSFRHLIAHCPHSYENMSSRVNYTEGEPVQTEKQVVLFTGSIKAGLAQLGNDARSCAVLDSACSSTVCGRTWLSGYIESLDQVDKEKVTVCDGVKVFKFGGGEMLKSLGYYEIPAVMAGKAISIRTDVVDSDIPLLLSIHAMKEARIKLDLGNDTAEILGQKVNLNYTSSGHYCIPIDKNEQIPIEEVHAVLLHKLDKDERYKTLLKLHRQFAHPPERKLVALLKDAGVWREEFRDTVHAIYERCQLCKIYTRTPARPAVALPMASQFNETVAMDLKKWRNGWILHLVDMWSRLTVSAFITRKTPSEVIDKIMTHWVGAGFGVMQSILTDNGGEFNAEEIREVASILNIRVHTTAAESPFQNGLCERIHSVTDMMLARMEEQCPGTPLDILLCWANMARNALQMWHGFSSYQLVFGKNPNLPNIMSETVPALDGVTRSESFAEHLNALHAARKAFIASEANERIRRALRCKIRASEEIYHHGDLVYYKRDGSEKWLGPGKVVFQDGKVVFVRHGGVFVRVSPNRLIKSGLEFKCDGNTEERENQLQRNSVRGHGFEGDRLDMQLSEMIAGHMSNENSQDDETKAQAVDNMTDETTNMDEAKGSKISLKKDDKIQFKDTSEDDWVVATVVSRGGKVSGRNKNVFNICAGDGETVTSVNLDKVHDWMKVIVHDVNVVTIPRSRHGDIDCVKAKCEELGRLREFDTCEEVQNCGQPCISTRWVICQKGDKVKARLVARGFEEDGVFDRDSPTVSKSALRMFLTLAVWQNWDIKTTDIKSAFLQGKALDRDVYIIPPKDASVADDKLWKLKHCLYGLNDAARQFYQSVRDRLLQLGCIQSVYDPALFYMKYGGCHIGMIACHVDDFLHCGQPHFDNIIAQLVQYFKAGKRESGQFKYVGFQITQNPGAIVLDQNEYVQDLEFDNVSPQRKSQKAENLTVKEHTVLRQMVGRINWVVQGCRPDIAFEMIDLSTKFKKGTVEDLLRAIKVIRKLKENEAKLVFRNIGNATSWKIVVFTDAAHANVCDGVGSVGAYIVFLLGENNCCCPLAWHAGKIKRVVRSTIAAETLSLQEGLEEAVYMRKMLEEVSGISDVIPVCAYVDNKSVVEAIHSTKLVDDRRLRLDIAAVQQSLQTREVSVVKWVPGHEQLANSMTKRGASGLQLLTVLQTGVLQL